MIFKCIFTCLNLTYSSLIRSKVGDKDQKKSRKTKLLGNLTQGIDSRTLYILENLEFTE